MKILYCIMFFFFINIQILNCSPLRKAIVHPIIIKYDYSNFQKKDYNIGIINLLKEAKRIVSKLVFCNNNRKLYINDKVMSKCRGKYLFEKRENITADLIIFPIIKRFYRKSLINFFEVNICDFFKGRVQPSVAILNINENINIEKIINNKNSKYILLLKILRALTDCLGLNYQFIKSKKQPRNNFLETPLYFISNSESFKSFSKLYKLSQKQMPKINVHVNGNFYISYWDEKSIVQDFRNEKIYLNSDMSETSMNLLNDMDYYKVAQCDFEFINKEKCFRVDQKCLNSNELNLYYLNYGINNEKENQIICYLSNPDNLKNNECGIKYGHLLHEIIDFCLLTKKYKIKNPKNRIHIIPELIHYKNQTLNLLVPSEKCNSPSPRTVYFKSEVRMEKEIEKVKIDKITLDEKQRDFFVTYLTKDETYFNEYIKILTNNGLIRSYYYNDNHNLFIRPFDINYLNKNRKRPKKINEYQKLFHFIGNDFFFLKDLLYKNYLYMKSYFPKSYSYMPKTYIYPKDKYKIEKRFKNYKLNLNDLWIVKPTNLFSGKGVHIFNSLNEEEGNHYIISKYLNNPHLILGRKYDLRLYVLVTGFSPLRIYLNKEGLVRIATNKYLLNRKSIKNKFIHLTNTAINQHNSHYSYPKNTNDESANKWNLNTYKNYLKKENIDIDIIFERIKDIVIKTIISGQKKIVNITSELNINDRSMFNLFGFDILIDNNFNPSLLEVNTRPFMYIYDQMDKIIKVNLFVDTLNIIGITPFSHQKKNKSYDKDSIYNNKVTESINYAYCELTRPRGDFELIFPLKENIRKYRRFFFKNASPENKMFWKMIKKDE